MVPLVHQIDLIVRREPTRRLESRDSIRQGPDDEHSIRGRAARRRRGLDVEDLKLELELRGRRAFCLTPSCLITARPGLDRAFYRSPRPARSARLVRGPEYLRRQRLASHAREGQVLHVESRGHGLGHAEGAQGVGFQHLRPLIVQLRPGLDDLLLGPHEPAAQVDADVLRLHAAAALEHDPVVAEVDHPCGQPALLERPPARVPPGRLDRALHAGLLFGVADHHVARVLRHYVGPGDGSAGGACVLLAVSPEWFRALWARHWAYYQRDDRVRELDPWEAAQIAVEEAIVAACC